MKINRKQKIITIIVITVIVLLIGYYFSSLIELVPPIFIPGSIVTEQGVIVTNTVDTFGSGDGPYFFIVRKETGIRSGDEIKVLYHPQSDDRTCLNAFVDGLQVKAGQKVEVHAVAINEDTLSICPSKDYYIKLLSQSPATQGINNECEAGKEYLPNSCTCPNGTVEQYLEYTDHTGIICVLKDKMHE